MSLKGIYRRAAELTRRAKRFAFSKMRRHGPLSNPISNIVEMRLDKEMGFKFIQTQTDRIGSEDFTCALNA